MFKLYKWLYIYIENKLRDIYLDDNKNDIKCPNCKIWFSISSVKYTAKHTFDERKRIFNSVCGQCGTESLWSPDIAPVLIRVDESGSPL